MIKSDRWITRMSVEHEMISPFSASQVRTVDGVRVVSYGVSSYGYDIRVGDTFRIVNVATGGITVIDPKSYSQSSVTTIRADSCIIPPNSFALANTIERFRIPDNVLAICVGKSTYARCGLIVNVTPLEPGWEGYLTLEISNTTPLPAKVYSNEGVAQLIFFESDEQCAVTYRDRNGKYQNQAGEPVLPRM